MSNRIVILVEGGVVDYVNDPSVEVLVIDVDVLRDGEDALTRMDIAGFADLVPQWVKDEYIED